MSLCARLKPAGSFMISVSIFELVETKAVVEVVQVRRCKCCMGEEKYG